MAGMMRVTQIPGERFRWYVHSETEGDAEHVVDLTENNGNGQCSCRDFETRCGPAFYRNGKNIIPYERDEKGKLNKDRTICKHINAVRNHLFNSLLPDMVKAEKPRPKVETVRESADGLPF